MKTLAVRSPQTTSHTTEIHQKNDFLDEIFLEHFTEAVHKRARQYGVNFQGVNIVNRHTVQLLGTSKNYHGRQQVLHAAMDAITNLTGAKYGSEACKFRVVDNLSVV